MNIYNCLAYNNRGSFGGYVRFNTNPNNRYSTYRNNIAYNNDYDTRFFSTDMLIHDHNSWNGGVTVNDADFVSLDTNQLYAPRKADGSLPDITFGHLVVGSDLIDKGVNVGLLYSGSAPDIGAFEKS
jgi:hypothetical protein